MAIENFADLMGILPEEIETKGVYKDGVVLDLDVPFGGIQRLHYLLRSNDEQIHQLEVEKIILEDESGQVEEWVTRGTAFDLVIPPHFATLLDETLVALYLGPQTTAKARNQIREELQSRYFPHHDPKQKDRSSPGYIFKKRVYAVLLAGGVGREQIDETCEKCANKIFDELFFNQDNFEKLLSDFDPKRASSRYPFQHWVVNVRVRNAVIDWLRKNKLVQPPPPNKSVEEESIFSGEGMTVTEYPKGGPWTWWDGFLPPRHGTIIRLFHLAYLEPNTYYLEQIAQASGKTKEESQDEIELLQQRLRPTRRFGESEQIQIYALEKMLETKELKSLTADIKVDETILTAIIAYAAGRVRWKYPDKPAIAEETAKEMLLETLGEQSQVADLKLILRRWIDFLQGELIEGELLVLKEEIEWRGIAIEQNKGYLQNLGLNDWEIKRLSQKADELTLEKVEQLKHSLAYQEQVLRLNKVKSNKREIKQSEKVVKQKEKRLRNLGLSDWEIRKLSQQADELTSEMVEQLKHSLAYQEQVLRFNKAMGGRDKLLAEYNAGKYLVTPLLREMAEILKLATRGIGKRVAEAKRALMGAIVWWVILKALINLKVITTYQHRVDRLGDTCVGSFEQQRLVIRVPGASTVRWLNVLLPCVMSLLQTSSVQEKTKRYGQTGLIVMFTDHKGDWPPLRPVWEDEASDWIWRMRQ